MLRDAGSPLAKKNATTAAIYAAPIAEMTIPEVLLPLADETMVLARFLSPTSYQWYVLQVAAPTSFGPSSFATPLFFGQQSQIYMMNLDCSGSADPNGPLGDTHTFHTGDMARVMGTLGNLVSPLT